MLLPCGNAKPLVRMESTLARAGIAPHCKTRSHTSFLLHFQRVLFPPPCPMDRPTAHCHPAQNPGPSPPQPNPNGLTDELTPPSRLLRIPHPSTTLKDVTPQTQDHTVRPLPGAWSITTCLKNAKLVSPRGTCQHSSPQPSSTDCQPHLPPLLLLSPTSTIGRMVKQEHWRGAWTRNRPHKSQNCTTKCAYHTCLYRKTGALGEGCGLT